MDPLTQGTFRLPEDALPPLAYVAPEAPSAGPAAGGCPTAEESEEVTPCRQSSCAAHTSVC